MQLHVRLQFPVAEIHINAAEPLSIRKNPHKAARFAFIEYLYLFELPVPPGALDDIASGNRIIELDFISVIEAKIDTVVLLLNKKLYIHIVTGLALHSIRQTPRPFYRSEHIID